MSLLRGCDSNLFFLSADWCTLMKESFDIGVGNAGLLCAIASLQLSFFAGAIRFQEAGGFIYGKFVVTKTIEEVFFLYPQESVHCFPRSVEKILQRLWQF